MKSLFSKEFIQNIQEDYKNAMKSYPEKKKEVDMALKDISDLDRQLCLQYLYAFMPLADIITYPVSHIYEFADNAVTARETISYVQDIPTEIFLAYVLYYRINNETIDSHRKIFYSELLPRIQKKSMKDAILEVNYWCYEKATYIPTDDRTISPLGMIKAAKGRCGEESTLAVAALRSVGIPARQCYVPRWAHCDDNHAWVEVWADGIWYYLGACEPEPILNKGWFTAAASKSMLVHSKAFSHYIIEEGNKQETPLFELVNSTKNYGKCKNITVIIKENGILQPQIPVRFELINYSELYPIYTGITDEEGKVSFVTGYGDIYIEAAKEDKLIGYKLDVRKEEQVILDFSQEELTISPYNLDSVIEKNFDMVPPTERIDETIPIDSKLLEIHKAKIADCEMIRSSYEKTFFQKEQIEKGSPDYYRVLAKGNWKEVDAFLENKEFPMQDKLDLLSTLREKDFVDITKEILAEYLKEASPWKGRYPKEIFQKYVLAPRIKNEMILANRRKIRKFFEEQKVKGEFFTDAVDVWDYLTKMIEIKEDYDCENIDADSYGGLYYKMCGTYQFPVLFVSACRALGMAARINPVTQVPEYIFQKKDGTIQYIPLTNTSLENENKDFVSLKLINGAQKPLKYETHFTIGYLENGFYQTLQYTDFLLEKEITLSIRPGSYRIITSARQIDGAVLAKTYLFHTDNKKEISIDLVPDHTKEKLKDVEIPDISFGQASLYQECKENYSIIIFAEPGKEPTEHLLQELLEHKKRYEVLKYPILILISDNSSIQNPTLQRVLKELSHARALIFENREYLHQLHVKMQVGDERLPFALVMSPEKKGLFAFANYNIGTAETMLSIIKVHQEK